MWCWERAGANLISRDDTVRFGVALHREKGQLLFPIQQQDPGLIMSNNAP